MRSSRSPATSVPGIQDPEVSFGLDEAGLLFDPRETSPERIIALIVDRCFEAER